MRLTTATCALAWMLVAMGLSPGASADTGRSQLLATGGVSTLEGSAGGGIVPMAVLSGYGTREEQGGAAFASHVHTPEYRLSVAGGSWSWRNRLEVSLTEQRLSHQPLSNRLGVGQDSIRQSVIGAKVRLLGDLIYTPWPQVSLGVQHKKNHDFFVPSAAGAKDDSGTDVYVSATKLVLAGAAGRNLLLNATLRSTKANQLGLVGFGGDLNDSAELMGEASVGVFLNRHWLLGAEYRQKPDNLSFISEDDWHTAFVAWFPNKQLSLVGAYVDLGEVATFPDQRGWYLSLQGSF
ncbi:DUF3034 family protein [Marinimicrobium sp. C2-29]|uniref:DUF3034 family protein n=1 Tax=Marinimicrobium sp. C2-29 TaxID=3139825 RepID=UPI00313A09D4